MHFPVKIRLVFNDSISILNRELFRDSTCISGNNIVGTYKRSRLHQCTVYHVRSTAAECIPSDACGPSPAGISTCIPA